MAFLSPIFTTSLEGSYRKRTSSATRFRDTTGYSTAKTPGAPSRRRVVSQSTTKPHRRTAANVIESQVASRIEAHHWVVIKDHSMRIFERAAVAQADAVRQIESRSGSGALHRWVLRQVADPTQPALAVQGRDGRYVVMEAFNASQGVEAHPTMRRWLSAVERVGPLMNAVDIRTLQYENLFTTKLHNVKFDPNSSIVVVESVNIDVTKRENFDGAVGALREVAELSVASGDCLEFCVLHAPGERGFFKTIEVYKNINALRKHMNGQDILHSKRLEQFTISKKRSRQTFKPVVFS